MRQTRKPQLALGEARIKDIKLDHKSRDDIPEVLLGLQHLYSHEETREKLFSLLEEHILPGTNRNVGRPGMELWRILVMGVLKQGLGCVRIPGQADHRFRRKPITHSDSSRSPIPDEPDQRFRSQADHFSAVTGIVPGVLCEGVRGAG